MIAVLTRSSSWVLLVLAVAVLLSLAACLDGASAAEFTVDSQADTTECSTTCTLRGAVDAAGTSPDAFSTITVPVGTYELSKFDEGHPTETGQLRLTGAPGKTIEIKGAGAGKTVIDAAKHDRVLRIGGGGSVVLAGLTLENGFPEGNPKDNTLEESVRGAGIYQDGGKVTLQQVRVTENQDNGFGAGVAVENRGTLRLVESELDHDAAADGRGGAVDVQHGTLIATGSSLDEDNSPTGVGGAVALIEHSIATFTNDTFADDGFIPFGDTYEGGALYLEESSATLLNVTFAGNGAFGNTNGGSDISANESSHLTFTNVLLGHGREEEIGEQECNERFNESGTKLSTWTDLGGNLSSDTTCRLAPADMGLDLKLGEPGSYGGPTRTVQLLEDSPAIDFGIAGCSATDQRGRGRVGNCDSGAFEYHGIALFTGAETPSPAPGGSGTSTNTPAGRGSVATVTTAGVASTPAAIEELLLGCGKRSLVLNDALISGGRVVLDGSAAKSLIGKQVKILFDGGKAVASATVMPDGLFSTTASLPPARLRSGNGARYMAVSGGQRSLNLKLTRRLILQQPSYSGGSVMLTGQVQTPLTKPISTVTVEQRLECGKTTKVMTFKPQASGRFHVTVSGIPANARAGLYRLTTSVLPKPGSHHPVRTFSLPLPVALG